MAALKYLFAALAITFVVWNNWTGLGQLFSQPPHAEPFLLAAAVLVGITAIQFTRWYLLVRALGLPFRFYDAVRLGLVGLFYNSFLPGSVGGDLVKAYFIAKGHPERRAAAVATVVADRLIGLFGLLAMSACLGGYLWANDDPLLLQSKPLQVIVGVCVALAVGAVAGYLALGAVSAAKAERVVRRLQARRRFGPTLAELWFTVWQYRQRPGTVAAAVAMSAVAHTGMVLIFHLAVRVFPPAPGLLAALPEEFVVIPIANIVQAMIPVPGGLGVAELSFGGLYNLIRPGGTEVGTAARLTMRLAEWAVGLAGFVAYLRMKAELPVAAAEEADEPAAAEKQAVGAE